MSKKFFKKIFVSLVLIAVLGVISAGCGTTAPPITPGPTGPTTYTVTVISADPWCYGTVYVSGTPTSAYLLTWGSATVYNVPAGAPIYLVDTSGWISHTEYFNPLFGNQIVFNYW
jgi:hypothetical protein